MILKSKKQKKIIGIISIVVVSGIIVGGVYITKVISNKYKNTIVLTSESENVDNSEEEKNENSDVDASAEKNLEENIEPEKNENNVKNNIDNNKESSSEKIVKDKVENKKNEQNKVSQPQEKQTKQTTTNPIKYRNEKLGIELNLPSYWKDKFTVRNIDTGIVIEYIFQYDYYFDYNGQRMSRGDQKTRYLVSIKDTSLLNENALATIDGIANVPKFKNIHGKKYVIGGPTDCLEKNDPDRPTVSKFLNDLPSIINSMKEI